MFPTDTCQFAQLSKGPRVIQFSINHLPKPPEAIVDMMRLRKSKHVLVNQLDPMMLESHGIIHPALCQKTFDGPL